MSRVRAWVLEGFDDPRLPAETWEQLLRTGPADYLWQSRDWKRTWWETCGRGRLLLIAAERDGRIVALAPLYADGGCVSFIGSEDADYLDFVGDVSDPDVLDALLGAARVDAPDSEFFQFYFVPDSSGTGPRLQASAARLGFSCYDEDEMLVPILELAGRLEAAVAATKKKSLLRHERYFRRTGAFEVLHLSSGEQILPHLDEFFEQHIARRAATPHPSAFVDPARRRLWERQARIGAPTGWQRFTRINWEGRPIAFHYGSCYRGHYYFGTSSFAIDLAHHSPGEVLLRQLLLAAIAEGAHTFDFGRGDEEFKLRFATRIDHIRSWGVYGSRKRVEESVG